MSGVLQHGGQLRHGGGADVRATGVAEEQQHRLALEVVAADRLAARAGQREFQVGQVALHVVERPVDIPVAARGKQYAQGQQQATPGAAGNEVAHKSRGRKGWKGKARQTCRFYPQAPGRAARPRRLAPCRQHASCPGANFWCEKGHGPTCEALSEYCWRTGKFAPPGHPGALHSGPCQCSVSGKLRTWTWPWAPPFVIRTIRITRWWWTSCAAGSPIGCWTRLAGWAGWATRCRAPVAGRWCWTAWGCGSFRRQARATVP
ncbi:hypothetical protein G6F57_017828 [Rhizopus arrhizus]|nr:hypothetical protein G6F57_017828 [Rhizopus arrhizus]